MEVKSLNIGIKYRARVVLSELMHRFIELIFTITMLVVQILSLIPMIFSQKHYDFWIDDVSNSLDDVEDKV